MLLNHKITHADQHQSRFCSARTAAVMYDDGICHVSNIIIHRKFASEISYIITVFHIYHAVYKITGDAYS